MDNNRAVLERARSLIQKREYREAYNLIKGMDDPTAQKWAKKLEDEYLNDGFDDTFPEPLVSELAGLSSQPKKNIPQAAVPIKTKSKSKPRNRWFVYTRNILIFLFGLTFLVFIYEQVLDIPGRMARMNRTEVPVWVPSLTPTYAIDFVYKTVGVPQGEDEFVAYIKDKYTTFNGSKVNFSWITTLINSDRSFVSFQIGKSFFEAWDRSDLNTKGTLVENLMADSRGFFARGNFGFYLAIMVYDGSYPEGDKYVYDNLERNSDGTYSYYIMLAQAYVLDDGSVTYTIN